MHRTLATVAACLASSPATACPLCESERADDVRAGLVDEDLGRNLAATVAPFVTLAGLVAAVRFGTAGDEARGRRS